jgi:hypothetical protein
MSDSWDAACSTDTDAAGRLLEGAFRDKKGDACRLPLAQPWGVLTAPLWAWCAIGVSLGLASCGGRATDDPESDADGQGGARVDTPLGISSMIGLS